MIFAFPVERWWGTYPVFFCSFVGWLYATYFSYKYFIVPRLFHKGDRACTPWTAIAVSLLVTFLFSSYEISSPFYHVRAAAGGDSRSELGRAAESAGPSGCIISSS